MNNMMVQSQMIAAKINNQLPVSALNKIQSAVANINLSQKQVEIAMRICNERRQEISNTFESLHGVFSVISDISEQIQKMNKSIIIDIQNSVKCIKLQNLEVFEYNRKAVDRYLFFEIADEIGLPIYLECDTILQDKLIQMYRENNNSCNVKEMRCIVMDYYNKDYIENICIEFTNLYIFDKERIKLLIDSMDVFQLGYYGVANSSFVDQISGMIRDIHKELSLIHKYSKAEKNEIKTLFDIKKCNDNSEKVMLLEILCEQNRGFLLWYRVAEFFLKYTYSSGKKYMDQHPKRHMICHGIQTNHDTREKSIELIICMDILIELAWQIQKMKEENHQMVIDC